jgi:hypothetical protein
MAKRLKLLHTLPLGTRCRTPRAPDIEAEPRVFKLLYVGEGSARVEYEVRKDDADEEAPKVQVPRRVHIALNTEVEVVP